MNHEERVALRRRTVVRAGALAMLLAAVAAATVGTGCIFDEGDYQGGGRRTGTPTEFASTSEPPPTSTPTSTSTTLPEEDAGDIFSDGSTGEDDF